MPLLIVHCDETGYHRRFDVRDDRFTIGRSPESDVRIEEGSVSRVHVVISKTPDGYTYCSGTFEYRSHDLSEALEGPGRSSERAARLVRSYLSALEEEISRVPEQYVWMHRRWKFRPPGAPDLYRDLDHPLEFQGEEKT